MRGMEGKEGKKGEAGILFCSVGVAAFCCLWYSVSLGKPQLSDVRMMDDV